MAKQKPRPQPAHEPWVRRAVRAAWNRREPFLWATIVVLAATGDWPALRRGAAVEPPTTASATSTPAPTPGSPAPGSPSSPQPAHTVAAAQPPSADGSGLAWRADLATALAEARTTNKLVLVDFYASWCPPCIAMKHEVWPAPEVVRAVNDVAVPLVVDSDRNPGLSSRYQVDTLPSVLLLDASGRVVKRHKGYLPRDGVVRFLGGVGTGD